MRHILRDRFVEDCFFARQLVVNGVGAPVGEKGLPFEADQLFLEHPAHDVRDVNGVDAFAKLALESICIQQAQEQLKVLSLPTVRRGSHEQEVTRLLAQKLAQTVPGGVRNLAAEVTRAHAVSLVHNDEVPVRRFEPRHVVVRFKEVNPPNQQVLLGERIAGRGRLDHGA